jgi:Nickel/cobalt transporter regulator
MRHHHLLAILLTSSFSVPVLAQEVETTIAAETQMQAAVVQTAMADQEERRDRRGGDGRWGNMNDGGAMPSGEQAEPMRRREWQQREQATPPIAAPQATPQAVPQPDWSARRGGGNEGGGGWQRREAPVMAAPPVMATPAAPAAPAVENRGWRGDWQRRVDEVRGTPPAPPVVRQAPEQANGNWRRGDRDRDGRPNGRDRDRDGDGIRNNRDWDRNNNGRVDGRWDRNNNGVVDRRYDRNRDGARDNRWRNNNGNWNNDRRWNNNRDWNRGWRDDRRYDWQGYRNQNRNIYRQPRYYSPYGYGHRYQQFGIGFYLESVLFGSRYRISDPWQYRLPQASWPYQWVRYYDDVILVDTRDGYVVDVIYNFFW